MPQRVVLRMCSTFRCHRCWFSLLCWKKRSHTSRLRLSCALLLVWASWSSTLPTGTWGHVQHMVCQVGRSSGNAAALLRCSVSVLRKVVVAERLSVLSHRCYHLRAQTHHETTPDVCTSLPHSVMHSGDCWCNLRGIAYSQTLEAFSEPFP